MKKRIRVLLVLFIALSLIVIPQELSWILNYSTSNVASAINVIEPQSPVAYDEATEQEAVDIDPSDYEEPEPAKFEEKEYNAETIAEDAEAKQAYRDSVDFVENKIVFSVLDYREKGAKAEYLKNTSAICRKYKMKNVEQIIEVKTDKAEKKAGLTAYQVFYSAMVKTDDIWAVVDKLAAEEGVISAEPDFIWESAAEDDMQEVTAEELEFSNWSEHGIDCENVWGNLTEGSTPGEGVVVAVIDTGVDYTHNDLKDSIWTNPGEIAGNGIDDDGNGYIDDVHGINLIDPNHQGDPMDDHGHGTHVSGIIAMSPGNGGGVGIAYGAKIMAVKAGQSNGLFASTDIAKAIQYASANGADVINMSFGGTGRSSLVEAALDDAFGSCVLVAAAGNSGAITTDYPYNNYPRLNAYPAGYSYVLGVMASEGDFLTSFSNFDYKAHANCEYELAAPGVQIQSTLPRNKYAKWSGTSMAAPIVSAAAAIIRRENPDKNKYSSRYIMGQLSAATDDLVYGNIREYKRLNILSSLGKTPKPCPVLSDVFFIDNTDISDSNNNDDVVQAGETIDMGFVLRNIWGISKDTTVRVDAISSGGIENPYITFINDTITLDDEIGTYAETNNGFVYEENKIVGVEQPIRIKISEDAPNDLSVSFRVYITAKNGMDENDTTVYEPVEYYEFYFTVQKGVYLRGIIENDMTLTKDNLWIVDRSLTIPENVTVNVDPGTHIQFYSSEYGPYSESHLTNILVKGTMNFNGTSEEPIQIFPSEEYEGFLVDIRRDFNQSAWTGTINMNYVTIYNPYLSISSGEHLLLQQIAQPSTSDIYYSNDTLTVTSRSAMLECDHLEKSIISNLNSVDELLAEYPKVGREFDTVLFNNNAMLFDNSRLTATKSSTTISPSYIDTNIQNKNSVYLNNYNVVTEALGTDIQIRPSKIILHEAFNNNAILNDLFFSHWMKVRIGKYNTTNYDIAGNYWGTKSSDIIEKIIEDAEDDANLPQAICSSILTNEDDLESIYPFVTDAYITDELGENRLDIVSGSQTVQMHVKFNRDMAQEEDLEPMVSFGPAEPYTDYVVQGDWVSAREWVGSIKIDPFINQGIEYIRIKDATAADDHWLVTGTDAARFSFEITKTSAEALTLQGNGGSNCNYLNWVQDDYDTLAGYNLYRSTSYDSTIAIEEQEFEKINSTIILNDVYEYTDYNVEQGVDYYYYFTVVDTDFNESEPSNVVLCTPLDEEAPVIVHDVVTAGTKGRQLSIDATLTDNVGVKSSTLHYRDSSSTSWQSADMKLISGDLYRGTISAYETKVDSLEYYLEVSDGTNTSYDGSETNPHVISLSDEIFAESIELSDQTISIAPGDTRKITAIIKPTDVTNTNVTWKSSNEKIATVDNEGNITGIKSGSVEITATASNGVSAVCTVTVELQTDTTIYAESIITSKGDTVDVPVMIRSNSGISSMRLKFSYDSEQLTPTAITKGDLLKSAYVTGNVSEPGVYYALFTNAKNISEDGLLYTITFDVARTAPDEGVDISLSYESGDVSNASHEDVQITTETIHIGFEDAVLGDVYEDGKINSHDMTSMQQYLTELITFTKHQKFLADLNEDDKVNMQDMVALAQKYLNPTSSSNTSGLMSILRLGGSKIEGSIGSAELGDDMKVSLPVTFTASPDIAAYKFAINYDGELYKLESIDSEGTDNGSFMTNVDDAGTGRAVVTWYGSENTDICTHTMTLNFTVVADDISEASTVTMTYEDGDICDLDGKSYEAEIASGTINPNGQGTYDEPVFTWEGHTSATAYFKCLTDENNSKTVEAVITKEVIKEATATETGEAKYIATVTFQGKEYTDVKVVETQYSVTEEELAQALADKEAAIEAKEAAEASLAQAQTDLANAQAAITTLNETIESKDATIEEKDAALAKANEDLETANAALQKANDDLTAANTQLAAANNTISELQETIDGKDEDLAQVAADLSAAQTELASTQSALETATANYNSTKADLDAANATITSLRAQLAEKEEELNQALADKEAAIEAKEAAEASLAQAQTDLANAQATITTLNETIESKDATIEEKDAALAKANEDLETANAALQKANDDLTEANTQLAAANAKIASYESSADDKDKELAQAKADLATAQAELTSAQAELETATANYNSTKAELDEAVEVIADLREQLANKETELQNAVNDKDQAEAALAAKTEELAEAREAEAQAKADMESAKEAEAQAKASAEAAAQKVNELTQEKAELEQQLANAGEANTQIQAELDRVNAELTAANNDKASAEAAAAAAVSEKEKAIEAKNDAEERANAAEAEVERLKAIINASDLSNASIEGLSGAVFAYTGAEITPQIAVKLNDKELAAGKDYTIYYINNINVGTATVIVLGEGDYSGACKASFGIGKAGNPLAVAGKTAKVKYKTLKKKKVTVSADKAFAISNAQGVVSYTKLSGNKKISISSAGKITVKKKLKKGKYKVNVLVNAAGNNNYEPASTIVTITIRVK